MATNPEHCGRCGEGVYFVVAETEENEHLHCFFCNYHESRVKSGYEVTAPGEPITKVDKGTSGKGGDQ